MSRSAPRRKLFPSLTCCVVRTSPFKKKPKDKLTNKTKASSTLDADLSSSERQERVEIRRTLIDVSGLDEFSLDASQSNQWFNFCDQNLQVQSLDHPTDTFTKLQLCLS